MSETPAPSQPLPTTGRLLKATAAAIVVAAILLFTTILPAEYGFDPTGIGTRLGLNLLAAPAAAAETTSVPAAGKASSTQTDPPTAVPSGAATVIKRNVNYRRDAMSLTLAAGEGAELKTHMKAGDAFVFHWSADGVVAVDMHGERVDAAKDEYTSYWIEREQSQASGTFTAPFDGTHGWYWRNRSNKPVTVQVDLSGFQQDLYRP